MDRTYRFTYLFDPLCGWCYAAAPALERIAERHGDSLRLMPTGLFTELRPVATIADHARANDDRIQELTGQSFTSAYHQGVMRAPGGQLSSLPLTRALVALGQINPALEPRFLHEAQTARYVEGRDTSRPEIVAGVAHSVAQAAGLQINEGDLRVRLSEDRHLAAETDSRILEGRKMMEMLGLRGIPQLVVTDGGGTRTVDSQTLYAGGDAVLRAFGDAA